MDAREIRKLILDSFFVIFGSAVLAAHLFALVRESGPMYFYQVAVLFFAALLICFANFIFYSKYPLTSKQMITRYIFHYFVTLGTATVAGIYLDWIICSDPIPVVGFLSTVSVFYWLMIGINEYRYKWALSDTLRKMKQRANDK